ncbi:hydroxyethylthiazole kinase [Haloimpatiens sp. FM7315]|uniref:hydroxyethylthiazole kinase n=1 Tax=Haloimpatiens sp. FM7315 TaxID=3298609 RepID=UPI00370C26FF
MFESIFENIKKNKPIVHCITNFVTVNDCANIILAAGGSPTMAHHKDEVEEITENSSSLVLNMGNVHDTDAMILAGKKSNEVNNPVVLDPVGLGASKLRNDTFETLSKNIKFSVIRGNISEIKAAYNKKSSTKGVDADEKDEVKEDNLKDTVYMAKALSKKTNSVIVISGAIDIVANREKAYIIKNGHPIMAKVTGTGCMSTALIGALVGASRDNVLEGASLAVAVMGVSGEIAYKKMIKYEGGTMMFRMFLIDAISNMTCDVLNGGINIEEM